LSTQIPDGYPSTAPIPVIFDRPRWRDTFASLRIHNYRLYVISQSISNTSAWMMRIATDWLVFQLTGSVTDVGITVALQFTPILFFGVWGGLIADRFDKRRLLMLTQALAAMLCAALAALTLLGVVEAWQVWATAFALGCVAVVDGPTRSAFVNEMVGHDRLRNAISVNASIFHLGGLVGPAISGILIALVGAGWSIGVNAVAASIVVCTLGIMRVGELLPSPRIKAEKGQIREGLRYVRDKPTILWPLIMMAFAAIFGMSLPVLLVAFADTVFNTGAAGYGLYSSAGAVGALSGALASTRRMNFRLRSIMLAAGFFGLALVATGISPTTLLFLVFLATIGFCRLIFATGAESIVQLSSNRAIRGRVMAVYSMVILGGQAIGGPIIGWAAEQFGVREAMVIAGAVPTAAAIVIAVLLARSGRLSLQFRLRRRGSPVRIVARRAASGGDVPSIGGAGIP
jgi:MFS family permease